MDRKSQKNLFNELVYRDYLNVPGYTQELKEYLINMSNKGAITNRQIFIEEQKISIA